MKRTILVLLLLALPVGALAAEPACPNNTHEFEWIAEDGDANFSGHSFATCIDCAFGYAHKELNRLAKLGIVQEGTVFTVEIEWKHRKFKQRLTAISAPRGELQRGPDKQTELPRGPYR